MYFLLLSLFLLGSFSFYKRKTIKKKWSQFREVNKLVKTHYKGCFKIFKISVSMIAKMYWINFIRWLEGSVEIVNNIPILSYSYNGRLYKLLMRGRKGPSPIIIVVDENGEDCSDLILPYFGPNYDWHGRTFTPEFWGKESLIFELASGSNLFFRKHDDIKINL